MRLTLSSIFAVISLAAAGCGGNVVLGGGGGAGGAGGAGGSTSTVDPTGMPAQSSAVILDNPDFVEIHIASSSLTCTAPDPPSGSCQSSWEITIGMTSDTFAVGTIDLETGPVKVFATESVSGPDPNGCAGAVGGGGLPGTLIIHSIGDATAEIELQGMNYLFLEGQPDGPYTAARCTQ